MGDLFVIVKIDFDTINKIFFFDTDFIDSIGLNKVILVGIFLICDKIINLNKRYLDQSLF